MKLTTKGFTLLEILVVVLIIGILGAIMLPQYQRAVLKSRFAALMPIAKSMADSNEAYYLEHGEYADNAEDLPVQGRQNYPNGTELEFGTSSDYSYVLATNQNGTPNNVYVAYQKHSKNFPGNIHCEAADDDELATWLCRDALHGTPVNTGEIKSLSGDGYTAYVLSGSTTGSTFDRSCEGEPETITQPCPSGCGVMSATPTCNPYTGEWEAQDFDPSTCPTQPEPETDSCPSGDGTKTRTASCNADGTAYEWGAWDESACCTGTPSATDKWFSRDSLCTGSNTGSGPVCVNGQWQFSSFTKNVECRGGSSDQCITNTAGASNGGPCTGTYTNRANCESRHKFGCVNSSFISGICYAYDENGCQGSTFKLPDPAKSHTSRCYGQANYGCANSEFTGPGNGKDGDVYCEGKESYGCANSTFTERSYCRSVVANACDGSTFKSSSYCQAEVEGACANVTYDGGCCYSQHGYCPVGSPKCIVGTYQFSNWNKYVDISGTW